MNERIKELAEQASHQSPDGYPVTIPYSKDFAEKFAELILEECAKTIQAQDVDPSFKNRMSWAIKKQFGVEE